MTSGTTNAAMRHRLARDERGTVLAIGVFASAFLIGAVYFLLGVGDAIDHRATMQDAADTGAYSVAVLHARAMNSVALLNMVKVSVAATLTSLLAIMAGATQAIAWISASQARLIAFGASIPVLAAIHAQASADLASIRGDADAVLRAADRAQETLRARLPEVAAAEARRAARAYGPPVEQSLVPTSPLPIRRGQPLALCERAIPFARPPALGAFDTGLPAPVRAEAQSGAEAALMPSCLGLGVAPMELEPGTLLGGDRLQLRAYVLGTPMATRGQNGVQIATWGRGEDRSDNALGFAQAEYYFDGNGAQAQTDADSLFVLGWRARYRRFRAANLEQEVASACRAAGTGACRVSGSGAGTVADIAERAAH